MKIRFKVEKKDFIWLTVMAIIAIAARFAAVFAWWSIPIFVAAFFGIKCLEIETSEKMPAVFVAAILALGATATMFLIQYMILDPELYAKTKAIKMFLNVLCILVFFLIVQAATNNPALSTIISGTALLSFGFVDYFIYEFRQNEFTFSDFKAMGTGFSVLSKYKIIFHDRGVYAIMGMILLITLATRFHVRFKKHWMNSAIMVLMAILCVVILGINTQGVNTETWEKKGTYRNGFILNFCLSVRDSFVAKPDGYSIDVIADLEEQYSGDGSQYKHDVDVDHPTIICIMSESYADLEVIGDFATNVEVANYRKSIKENAIHGYALSSVFGAKTPNSEWEFMTGNSMAFLPSGSVVYQQYISDEPTSLVSILKNEGYTCVSMHPYYDTGWSRNTIYPTLGFDESYFLDDYDQTQILREYITDEEFYNKIIERYESKGKNEDLFIMSISMQNHGGYKNSFDNFDEQAYKIGKSYNDVNQYLSLVYESDQALRDLITYFSNVDEPVEIVFFGDHQPSLNSKFYKLLNGKGMEGLTNVEMQALYTVPFFIWTNYESEELEVPITSLNYLSTMALQRANIELPAYRQFLVDLSEEIPAINSQGYYSKEYGTYMLLEDATGTEAEWIQKYQILQYNGMFDEKRQSKQFFPYLEEQ